MLVVLVACAGCTDQMWRSADEPTVRAVRMVGLTAADAAGGHRIVVEYRPMSSDGRYFLTVPADADGGPRRPFRPATRPSEVVWADVPASQRAAIVETAGAVGLAANVVTPAAEDGYPDGADFGEPADPPLWAVAYRLDPAGRPTVESFQYGREPGRGNVPGVPPGCHVLFVPADRPRPAADRERARLRAALLTPFTVVVDVPLYVLYFGVVYPYALIYTGFGQHGGC